MGKKAIFLDKDGTLIPNIDRAKFRLEDHTIDGLRLLAGKFLFVVVSNQPDVARGLIKEQDLIKVRDKIGDLFLENSILLDGFYYCPHDMDPVTGETRCDCRKPQPGLIFQAAMDKEIILEESWMIGDILNDIEAGNRAGCHTILIDNGNETEWKGGHFRTPTLIASNLREAAGYILNSVPIL